MVCLLLAWAQAHPDLRAGTLLVSTAGANVSAAGMIARRELLSKRHPTAMICDIYDGAGDPAGEKASTRLKEKFGHSRYRDFKPTFGVKDWEKELARRAEQQRAVVVELHPGSLDSGEVQVGGDEEKPHI